MRQNNSPSETAKSILDFWFGSITETSAYLHERTSRWFMGGPTFDEEIRERFAGLVDRLASTQCAGWTSDPLRRLAAIIVLDQFSRNIFRGTPRAFAQDPLALTLAEEAIARGEEKTLHPIHLLFLYLPFEHSENLAMQERSVGYYKQLVENAPGSLKKDFESNLDYAIRHRDIIERFGRFPHRNPILKRESTQEELEFLKTPGSSF